MSAEAIKERIYQELTPNERGWLWCQRLGLWLGTWEGAIEGKPGTWLRFYDQQNNLVLLPEEAAQQQGLQQGACRSLLHLLIARFGEVPQEVTTRLQALDVEQLEELAEAILSQSEFNYCQFFRKIFSEAIAGIWIGLVLGVLMVGIALLLKGTLNVAIVVGISLMAITILSTIFGVFLPLLFKALGFDPAMMSAPLSATIVDVIGVSIYLEIARVML